MIIGAAFTACEVNSVVSNLFIAINQCSLVCIDFSNLYLPLSEASKEAFVNGADIATARSASAVLPYGTFITDLIQFLILAFVVFLMIRALTKLMQSARRKKLKKQSATTKNVHSVKQKSILMQLNV